MKLYAGTTTEFVQDALENKLDAKIKAAYESYFYKLANPREVASWTYSLQFVKNLIELASLNDNMIMVEYVPPFSNMRIDCVLFGKGQDQADNAVLIELKQWTQVTESDVENNVTTFVGGGMRPEAHPSYQVAGYHNYLKDYLRVFEGNSAIQLNSIAYCHNYSRTADVLFGPQFDQIRSQFPLFAKEDVKPLAEYLRARLGLGHGWDIFNRFTNSEVGPSKKLLAYAKQMIAGQEVFHLVEDQITAYNTVVDRAKKSSKLDKKSVILVRGGPGTGKSLIALNAMAELGSHGPKGLTVFHATGSAAFTSTLRRILGQRTGTLFKYFNGFGNLRENEVDVLICDEAHRIRKTSNDRFTRKTQKSNRTQLEELIRVAKVSIFFIDDYQIVRPSEIGSTSLIKEMATKLGAEVHEFELKTQFR